MGLASDQGCYCLRGEDRGMSDYDIRGRGIEQVFALNPIPDDCIDAANRAGPMFDRHFPGWQLYSRIIRGDRLFDRQLAAWAISMGRMYSRAKKVNGRHVVRVTARKNTWIAQASVDALEFVIQGEFSRPSAPTADQLGIDNELYSRFRIALAAMIAIGFQGYSAILHWEYTRNRISVYRNGQNSC